MNILELLRSIYNVSQKARNIAVIIRSEPALLQMLVEEKTGADKNKRFAQDFKTLADVLIQEMVSHDLSKQVNFFC